MPMKEDEFYDLEFSVFTALEGKLANINTETEIDSYIERVTKSIHPTSTKDEIDKVVKDAKTFGDIDNYLNDDNIEDIMINNTANIFIYKSDVGETKAPERVDSKKALALMVARMKMYNTHSAANRNIFDVHLPNGSRANIVETPLGPDITIRNFKNRALSIIDLINAGEFSNGISSPNLNRSFVNSSVRNTKMRKIYAAFPYVVLIFWLLGFAVTLGMWLA